MDWGALTRPKVGSVDGEAGQDERLWQEFLSAWGREVEGWVEAERTVADAQAIGYLDTVAGDRLLVAEASLQRLIVDFAASVEGVDDPTTVALGLLRRAERLLADRP